MPTGTPIPVEKKIKIVKLALATKEGGGKMVDVAEMAGISSQELTRWTREYNSGMYDKKQSKPAENSKDIDLSAISSELKRLGNIGEQTNKILLKLIEVLKSMPEEDEGDPISEEDEENFMGALENSDDDQESGEDNQGSSEEEHY